MGTWVDRNGPRKAIMGFGGGALIASPLSQQLMSRYDDQYDPSVSTSVAAGGSVATVR